MKEEIAATVFFIARLAKEKFAVELTSVLFENYKSHWYPENPTKGQAFRCLRMNKAQTRDPVIERACRQINRYIPSLKRRKETQKHIFNKTNTVCHTTIMSYKRFFKSRITCVTG
uniref:B-cell translocation gene 4 n=1 Tax=Sinocyclocheilus rhinocerous TaxID=307959 RepID=A0A673G2V0_9TELE